MKSICFLLVISVVAFILTYLVIFPVRKWALRSKMLDIPGERSSHVHPTPTGGGVVMFSVTTVLLFLIWSLKLVWPGWWLVWSPSTFLFFFLGSLIIAVISWLDDVWSLSIHVRFFVQCIGAILAIKVFGCWREAYFPLLGQVSLGWLGLPITFLWIVGMTNAYNFMDGIDGIAGSQGVLAGFGWALLCGLAGLPLIGVLAILLSSTCLGFLFHNWFPARIFMGDVGSAFLGYIFAILPVIAAQSDPKDWAIYAHPPFIMVGVLLVWPFIFDTTFTFLRRLCYGENVFTAHRSHLYQRLVISGCSHQTVSLIYMVFSTLGLLCAVFMVMKKPWIDLVVMVVLPGAFFGLWTFAVFLEKSDIASKTSANHTKQHGLELDKGRQG